MEEKIFIDLHLNAKPQPTFLLQTHARSAGKKHIKVSGILNENKN